MINNINVQVLLVTGGYGDDYLDSTELLLPSATSWTTSAALPSPRYLLRGATLDNKVIMTGTNSDTLVTGHDLCCYQYSSCDNITHKHNAGGNTADTTYDDILEFNTEDGTWIEVGSMVISRSDHAVSVINYREIAEYCNQV